MWLPPTTRLPVEGISLICSFLSTHFCSSLTRCWAQTLVVKLPRAILTLKTTLGMGNIMAPPHHLILSHNKTANKLYVANKLAHQATDKVKGYEIWAPTNDPSSQLTDNHWISTEINKFQSQCCYIKPQSFWVYARFLYFWVSCPLVCTSRNTSFICLNGWFWYPYFPFLDTSIDFKLISEIEPFLLYFYTELLPKCTFITELFLVKLFTAKICCFVHFYIYYEIS